MIKEFEIDKRRGKTDKVRVFPADRLKIVDLQKEMARELDLVSVSQAQVVSFLLRFRECVLGKEER